MSGQPVPKRSGVAGALRRLTDVLFEPPACVICGRGHASTGWLVEQIGWFDFFLLCTGLALPGMALLLRVAPWRERPV